MLERLVGHDRSKIGPADSDIDDVPDAFARVAFPFAIAHAIGEVCHPIEHRMHVRHNILSINQNRGILWCPQGGVQDCAFLRNVDLFPAEHGVDSVAQARLLRQAEEAT